MASILYCSLFLIFFTCHLASANDSLADEFAKYVVDFKKQYTPVEYIYRLQVFKHNLLVEIPRMRLDNPLARYGVTPFADWTSDEFHSVYSTTKAFFARRKKNIKKKQNGKRQETSVDEEMKKMHVDSPAARYYPLQQEGARFIDWRDIGAVTAVQDQGPTCGACWAFTTAANVESTYWIAGHRPLVALSAQELLSCDTIDHGCGGGTMDDAYQWILSQNGSLATLDSYPYSSWNGTTTACLNQSDFSIGAVIDSYIDLASNESVMADYVWFTGPISVAVDNNGWQHYTGGVVTNCSNTEVQHSVVVVGFNDKSTPPYWILKNSYGPNWGDEGYIMVEKGTNQCLINTAPSSASVKPLPTTTEPPPTTLAPTTAAPPPPTTTWNPWPPHHTHHPHWYTWPPFPSWIPGGTTSSPNVHRIVVDNSADETVWVAVLGNPGMAIIAQGGFMMERGADPVILEIPVGWQGRLWARTNCNFTADGDCPGTGYAPCCASGSCLQANGKFGLYCAQSGLAPASLIEMTFDAPSGVGPYDVYDISLVDGWSVPLSIVPINGTFNLKPDEGNPAPWCEFTGCDAAPTCPSLYNVSGTDLSCWSPCHYAVRSQLSMHEQEHLCCVCSMTDANCDCDTTQQWGYENGCCNGKFGCTPYHSPPYPSDLTCDPWSTDQSRQWPADALSYISNIKQMCSQVYAWQFDDKAATFQCRKTDGLVDYYVRFVTRLKAGETLEERKRKRNLFG